MKSTTAFDDQFTPATQTTEPVRHPYDTSVSLSQNYPTMPLYAAPVPASHKGATHCDDCGLTWLDDGLNPLGCPYCKAAAPQAPDVPKEWKQAVSEFLSSHDAAWAELFKSMPANTRSVTVSNHQADAVRKANVLRALLQSAEVRHD